MGDEPDLDLEYEPDLHDYHQSRPRRQMSPIVETDEAAADERESKRRRVLQDRDESSAFAGECTFAYMAMERVGFLDHQANLQYQRCQDALLARDIELSDFIFGVHRNDFYDKYQALAAVEKPDVKKRGRKEIKLNDLDDQRRMLFTGTGGADEKEWSAWKSKEACEVIDYEMSQKIRREKPDLIVPTRWVRTNKNDGPIDKDFLAKSRLVVQGFKDKCLGHYRRDAPTASAIAESICLGVCAYYKFVLIAKDIKNAYFSGKAVGREVYLEPPKGTTWTAPEGQESHLRLCGGGETFLASLAGTPFVRWLA